MPAPQMPNAIESKVGIKDGPANSFAMVVGSNCAGYSNGECNGNQKEAADGIGCSLCHLFPLFGSGDTFRILRAWGHLAARCPHMSPISHGRRWVKPAPTPAKYDGLVKSTFPPPLVGGTIHVPLPWREDYPPLGRDVLDLHDGPNLATSTPTLPASVKEVSGGGCYFFLRRPISSIIVL